MTEVLGLENVSEKEIKDGLERAKWNVDQKAFTYLLNKFFAPVLTPISDADSILIEITGDKIKKSEEEKGNTSKYLFMFYLERFMNEFLISEHKLVSDKTLISTLTSNQIKGLANENKDRQLDFLLKNVDKYKEDNLNLKEVMEELLFKGFPDELMEELSELEEKATEFFNSNGDSNDLKILADVFEYMYDAETAVEYYATEYDGNILIDSVNKIKERFPNNAYLEKSKINSESATYDLMETISNHL